MKKACLLLVLLHLQFFRSPETFSQVAINTDGSAPATSAMLDVKSASKGFLPPRVSLMSATDVATVPSPVAGLLVYNTNTSISGGCGTGYYSYNGAKWLKLAANTTHYLGEFYAGGNVFWLDETGEHGLVAAMADVGPSAGVPWSNVPYKITGANADGVYAGKYNTDKIIAAHGAGSYAAILCRDYRYSFGNVFYTDWYLPSKFELNLMYANRALLASFNYSYGVYWSSTEGTQDAVLQAFDQVFLTGSGSGIQDESPKEWGDQVRCIRKF